MWCWIWTVWTTIMVAAGQQNSSGLKLDTRANVLSTKQTHLIIAPHTIRPGTRYAVVAMILDIPHPVEVRASIHRNDKQITSQTQVTSRGFPETLLLQVPPTTQPGTYKLRVEGNHVGGVGGSIFSNQTLLDFSPKFLTILIQFNNPIYKQKQDVKFRIVMLTTAMKPYTEPVDVYIINPVGIVCWRWLSHQTDNGVLTLSFYLDRKVQNGFWKVRISAGGQLEEKTFIVNRYHQPLFETAIYLQPFFVDTDDIINGYFEASYGSDKFIRGNATVSLYAKKSVNEGEYILIDEEHVAPFYISYDFSFDMGLVLKRFNNPSGVVVRIEASVIEYFTGIMDNNYVEARIINSSISINFLSTSPAIFKPGMNIEEHVTVNYHDGHPLEDGRLNTAEILVVPTIKTQSGTYQVLETVRVHPRDGTGFIQIDVPDSASEMVLTAKYIDQLGGQAKTELEMYAFYSPKKRYLKMWSSTHNENVGNYVVFHVRSNFIINSLQYVVVSKGLLLLSDSMSVDENGPTIKTFVIPLSPEMVPKFQVVVFHVADDGEVITDSMTVPVNSISQHKVSLEMNQSKDHKMTTVEMTMRGAPGAYFGSNCKRHGIHNLHIGDELSKAQLMRNLHLFDKETRTVHEFAKRYRDGKEDEVIYFHAPNYGIDADTTFERAGLVVFTDAVLPNMEEETVCDTRLGLRYCLRKGCYTPKQRCDGVEDCEDGLDEAGCLEQFLSPEEMNYTLYRIGRYGDLYDEEDGIWAWQDTNIGPWGWSIETLETPKSPDIWICTGFAINEEKGLGLIPAHPHYETVRPFYTNVEAPTRIRAWEQVGIRVLAFNNMEIEVRVLITLKASPDYLFVEVEKFGGVNYYSPRLTSGDHQHLVYIEPDEMAEVLIPIVPTVDKGTIEVTIETSTFITRESETIEIEVVPEGVEVAYHLSTLLDLKNRASVIKFLDIPMDESPLIPYSKERRFLFGSSQAKLSVCGDVIGPVMMTVPMTLETVFGRRGTTSEEFAFEFGMNMWSLHYLRLTNQWNKQEGKEVLSFMNTKLAQIIRFRHSAGAFSFVPGISPSVWLTAWIIRILQGANFPEWETYIYIDEKILETAVSWILDFQHSEGYFEEFNKTMKPFVLRTVPFTHNSIRNFPRQSVVLTAHVLITIQKSIELLSGQTRSRAVSAKIMATQYLERSLSSIEDSYELAIATYALTLVNSPEKELAFKLLATARREQDGMLYWSRDTIPPLMVKWENSKPFYLPKKEQEWDAVSVESTAYGLLVYLLREGVNMDQEKMALWLNSMRMHTAGFVSTVDTLVAMESLTEYSYRARLRDVTDIKVTVVTSASPNLTEEVIIKTEGITRLSNIDISKPWGHVTLTGKGAGKALIQMDVSYGADHENQKKYPPQDAYELDYEERYSKWRNGSIITVRVCPRWINLNESLHSGLTLLTVQNPSGYIVTQTAAQNLVNQKRHPNLIDASATETEITWYFAELSSEQKCFTYRLNRWFPVANLTRTRGAIIYDAFQPERFLMKMIDGFTLSILNICEVCGSYQCPYCPIYNEAAMLKTVPFMSIFIAVILHLIS